MAHFERTLSGRTGRRASSRSSRDPGLLARAHEALATWSERRRQRRALLALDDRLLHDLGLSRSDVEQEAAKPFWR